jgi:hypothetical protein
MHAFEQIGQRMKLVGTRLIFWLTRALMCMFFVNIVRQFNLMYLIVGTNSYSLCQFAPLRNWLTQLSHNYIYQITITPHFLQVQTKIWQQVKTWTNHVMGMITILT